MLRFSLLILVTALAACGAGKPIEDSVGGSVRNVDHTPPPAPIITTPDSAAYTSHSASRKFTIRGNVADEVVQLVGTGGVTVQPNAAREWSFEVDLNGFTPVVASFFAKDFAGNVSTTAATVTLTWQPPALFLLGGVFPGASVTNSGHVLEATVYAPVNKFTDVSTHFTFESGFNRAVQSSRSL